MKKTYEISDEFIANLIEGAEQTIDEDPIDELYDEGRAHEYTSSCRQFLNELKVPFNDPGDDW